MKDNKNKKALDNTINILDKVLSAYKEKEDIKEIYQRVKKLKNKRNLE